MFGGFIVLGIIAVGVSVVIESLLEEEQDSRDRMHNARRDFRDSVINYENTVRSEDRYFNDSRNFAKLHSKYIASVSAGQIAYDRYSELKQTINYTYKLIKKLKTEKQNLKNSLVKESNYSAQKEIRQIIKVINIRLTESYNCLSEVKDDKNRMFEKMNELNIHTAELRERIHTKTGNGGRVWYKRLEERKRLKRIRN